MERIRVSMTPHPDEVRGKEHSGIAQVVLNWAMHLPNYGVDVVAQGRPADLSIGHAASNPDADIHVSHGLLWTEEISLGQYAYDVNADLVRAATYARTIITPSEWVADVYRRDMRKSVHVIWHGINPEEWEHDNPRGDYVLYTKNRTKDGLDPSQVNAVALALPYVKFYTTFATRDSPPNVITYGGTVPFTEMKRHIQQSGVVFMPDRETWGITAAEAMAAGVPVCSTSAGAVKDFVTHGENGYIYQARNLADAIQGIKYCLQHGAVLGDNGRHTANSYLYWPVSINKVANVIRRTHEGMAEERRLFQLDKLSTVAVVITSHNYGHLLTRAVESILAQTWQAEEIVIVDDSSDDNTGEVAKQLAATDYDTRIKYRRVDVGNVALARNEGIYSTDCRFIVTLDGDDWLRPDYIKDCIQPLLRDRGIGFAYSSAEVVLEETGEVTMPPSLAEQTGKRPHRPWPTMDYDKQFMTDRANQFPATVIFRRKALMDMGGYRPRYAPDGAGTEDAHLYLTLLRHGWRGVMVEPTIDNLWVHTHGSGHVSGMTDYEEVDWRAWFPETRDYRFPFAAVATPKNKAHPIRSYEPEVSVIIPVGPGHEKHLMNALDSLEAQVNRQWEAVVVWDFVPDIEVSQYYERAYPYVRWTQSFSYDGDKVVSHGPGAARNQGAWLAQAPYITFLDADDYYSPDFLIQVNPAECVRTNAIVYSEYYSRMSKDMHPRLGGTIVKEEGDSVIVDNSFHPYDANKASLRPEGDRPYVWSGVNIMLPKEWHNAIGGFDEELDTWEDCLYLLQLAWHGYMFRRIDEPLWVYSFTDGARREVSAGKEKKLMTYFKKKYDETRAEA